MNFQVYIIVHKATGKIEPSSSRREGVWKSRATALQRIKSHWHCPWDWRASIPGESWQERYDRHERLNEEFRTANPFDEWWPKHYEIIEMGKV